METADFNRIYAQNAHKTRVLVFGNPSISKLLKSILEKHGVNAEFISKEHPIPNRESDFIILEHSDISESALYKPNLVFIAMENSTENFQELLSNIVGGGILIYNENNDKLSEEVKQCENYFRKIPYTKAFTEGNMLKTEFGDIPLSLSDSSIEYHLEGAKLFCQQFSIMEEDFYEALMNFDI